MKAHNNHIPGFPMARSIAFEDLATVVYVWVDDWYQAHAAGGRQGQAPLQRQ